jgi:flagellar biosynthetic protein FliO
MRHPLLLLVLLLAPIASAADAPAAPLFSDQEWSGSERVRPSTSNASPGAAVLQLAAALGLVLAIAGGAGWAIKRAGLRRFAPGGRGRHLQLIETVAVGPRRAVSLVRVGEQVLVIGQSEQSLTHLATMAATALGEPVPAGATAEAKSPSVRTETPQSRPSGFARVLDSLTGRRG